MTARCRRIERVLPYVDGELAAAEAAAFEDHVEACAACRRAVAVQRALEEKLVLLPRPRLQLADALRLEQAIAEQIDRATRGTPPRPRLPALRRVAAAAAVLGAAALGLARWRTAGRVDAPVAVAPVPAPAAPREVVFESRAGDPALLEPARAEVVRVLATLPDEHSLDDPLAAFHEATKPLREARVPLLPILEQLLKDPDPAPARAAARLLALDAGGRSLGPEDPVLVPLLESAMRRADRGDAMVRALVAIGSPRAWAAVAAACELPHLRRDALVALAGRRDGASLPLLQCELQAELKRRESALVDLALAELPAGDETRLKLLAELLRAGAAPDAVAAALRRARLDAADALAAMLATRGAPRRDALLLAPLLQDEALVAPLAELVARSDDPSAAAQALARIDGAPTVVAFATLAAAPSLSRSRARILSNAFGQWLARCEDPRATLDEAATRLREDARALEALVGFTLATPAPGGAGARLALIACRHLSSADRVRLVEELLTRREPAAPAELLGILGDASAQRDEGAGAAETRASDRLLAALLLCTYVNGGDEPLLEGARAVGGALTPARETRLRTTARALASSLARPGDRMRFDGLLELAP
ncbi:MAG TPA: zf-HC2 domain-containing protein [Planctomycetota bacterium]|nr:zf-HC2 domain-containing protein [Planctomycetota bacterium]